MELNLIETYHNEQERSGHGSREFSITEFTIVSPRNVVLTALSAFNFERVSACVDSQWSQDIVKENIIHRSLLEKIQRSFQSTVVTLYPYTIFFSVFSFHTFFSLSRESM